MKILWGFRTCTSWWSYLKANIPGSVRMRLVEIYGTAKENQPTKIRLMGVVLSVVVKKKQARFSCGQCKKHMCNWTMQWLLGCRYWWIAVSFYRTYFYVKYIIRFMCQKDYLFHSSVNFTQNLKNIFLYVCTQVHLKD